ncbi:hypothetical protein [Hydrotalea sandarakina]|jgi:hypothetical protein|uniref:Short chain amide porin n=1 Tax=Hydrotalea sandarakina TaxID=1004304 RepID=A0A2W7RWF7_9BACT|nr:hypothetical protein [Hydrotalea sandarakina]PZX64644.1 hypothetical protein LX80_00842 [Hydrotalea sandarakina]
MRFIGLLILSINCCFAQQNSLRFSLNESGSQYFQFTFLNQVWLRYNQNNPGTTVEGDLQKNTFDIGLRRTRIQMFGKITDRAFLYFQFGQNNFNAQYNSNNGNRKVAAFFHDALCEYSLTSGNELKLGAGLTIAAGLSRFTQPSISSILTMDVPVFLQTTVDQTDIFSRKLSFYARGQLGKFDYRFILSDPFPITSAGTNLFTINSDATFAQKRHNLQQQAYIIYQFFEQEPHTTPYMAGTYLGKKKIWNIAMGGIYQANASWHLQNNDTLYQPMQHFAIESFLDMSLNSKKGSAISAYLGYINTNYGKNYLRYNGIMNPANGTVLNANNSLLNNGPVYGNALPMFGTGHIVYAQLGYLIGNKNEKVKGKFLPYASATLAKYDKLNGLATHTFNVGLNYLMNGQQSKITLDIQNRPVYAIENNVIVQTERLNAVTLQYQLFL